MQPTMSSTSSNFFSTIGWKASHYARIDNNQELAALIDEWDEDSDNDDDMPPLALRDKTGPADVRLISCFLRAILNSILVTGRTTKSTSTLRSILCQHRCEYECQVEIEN